MIEPREALRRYPLFSVLPADWLTAWLGSGEADLIEARQPLFAAGSPGTHVFLISSGTVRVWQPGKGGREISLGTLRAGEMFGEYALLPPGLNTATCRGAEAGQVLRLPLAPLRERLNELL